MHGGVIVKTITHNPTVHGQKPRCNLGMADQGTSVTLIFYKIGSEWYREPALNLLAAAAQFSSYTHVELAIGEVAGQGGMMANVARIYNDNIGVVSPHHHALRKQNVLAHTPIQPSTHICAWHHPRKHLWSNACIDASVMPCTLHG